MFHRIVLEEWQRSLALLGWVLFAAVFLGSTLAALLLPRDHIRKLEHLPLEEEPHE